MATIASHPGLIPPRRGSVPALQNGDQLTLNEFERRYNAMPGVNKAQLIEGIVYMPSPVKIDLHGEQHAEITTILGIYKGLTLGVRIVDNGSIRIDLENMPQPDLFLMLDPSRGGQSRVQEDGYGEGAPELVVEIANTSATIDLHDKLRAYRRAGVKEYIVWRTYDEAIDCLTLREGEYVPLPPTETIFKSHVFPGLWIDRAALLRRDLAMAMKVVQEGIASPEHRVFVAPSGK